MINVRHSAAISMANVPQLKQAHAQNLDFFVALRWAYLAPPFVTAIPPLVIWRAEAPRELEQAAAATESQS